MIEQWLSTSWTTLGSVVLSTVVIFVVAVAVIRLVGLRALSKMSSFDFVVTVALGSIVATAAATSSSVWNAAAAFVTLLAVQWAVATLRRRFHLSDWFDNEPLMLMDRSGMFEEHLDEARVTVDDVFAKLREANVTDLDQVLAVVLETTGDISVLHGDGPLQPDLLRGVRTAL
jgi:uncharacterized membrane protein YcaP (DUF421 family)